MTKKRLEEVIQQELSQDQLREEIQAIVSEEITRKLHDEEQINEVFGQVSQFFQSVSNSIESFIGIPTENVVQSLVSFTVSQTARFGAMAAGMGGSSLIFVPIAGSVIAGLTFKMLFTEGKQKRLWDEIENLVQKRDRLIDKIQNSEMSQKEVEEAYGDQLETLTNKIRKRSNQLYNMITSRKGREGMLRKGLSEDQIDQVEQYLKIGMSGGFSNQSKMTKETIQELQDEILNEQQKQNNNPNVKILPVYKISDQLIEALKGQKDYGFMETFEPSSGSAVGNKPLQLIFKQGKQKDLWKKLNNQVEERDRILRSINQSDMSKEEVKERYAKRLDTVTSSIRETSQELYNHISSRKGKAMLKRNNITEKECKQLLDIIHKGIESKFSNYLPILAAQQK